MKTRASRAANRPTPTTQALHIFLSLVVVPVLACQHKAPATAPPPENAAVFEIYPEQKRQTISHLGSGNFVHRWGNSSNATEPISNMNIALLQPRFARVSIELGDWEPVNDNADPLQTDPSAFIDGGYNHAAFELMKQLCAQGVEIIATVWHVPDWLVQNPEVASPRIIDRSMYPEAVESIAAWLLHAKQVYGVEVSYVSFNEANMGIDVLLSSQDYVQMIRLGGRRFAELGLTSKWLLGDCFSIGVCLDYVKPIWAAEDIRSYLGPLAFHNYDADTNSDERLSALGDWAAEQGLETRSTEASWDPELWRRPQILPLWDHAHQLMLSFNRTIKLTRATTLYYWQMLGSDNPLNDGSRPYMAMEMLRQLSEAFPPGSQVVGTSPNPDNIALFAARTPDGGFGVHLVNVTLDKNGAPEEVRIHGLPEGEYKLHLSEDGNLNQPPKTMTTQQGSLAFALPGSSVGYLVKVIP
jgi:O-glycosyl hydrolase